MEKRILFFLASLAAISGLLYSCEQAVEEVAVTAVIISQPSAEMIIGETLTLTATVSPSNATDQEVTWASSDQSVATVDDNGTVDATSVGETIITATAGSKTAVCQVTVKRPLPSFESGVAEHISAISAVLKSKLALNGVSGLFEYGFMYSSSAASLVANPIIIKADNLDSNSTYTVIITNLSPETTYYYRSYLYINGNNIYGEIKSFTTKEVSSVIQTQEASMVAAVSAKLNATLNLTDVDYEIINYGFLWSNTESNQNHLINGGEITDNIFTASLTGLSHKTQYWYKAYVIIDSQTFYGEVKTFTTDVVPVESVSLDKTEYTFNTVGNALTLQTTILPADATDKSVEWTSDREDVATIDANGKVTAKGNGKANITVTTKDQGKTASCVITVAQWVTSIILDKTSIALNEGQEQTLIPTINPSNAADKSLNWISSDTSVATVDADGKVTAISKGTATIRASANDGSGKYASCSVTVKRPVTSIQLDKAAISIYNGKTETLTATITPSDASNTSVTWASSNIFVATVSNSGVVTGHTKGSATITASADDGSGVQATCEVEVNQYVMSVILDKTLLSLEIGDEASLSVSILPDNANDKTYTWSSSDNTIASVDNSGKVTAKVKGKATIKASANDGGGAISVCSVIVSSKCPDGAVDMGTTSTDGYKLFWSTCNIGASKPGDYGDYYAWGETETKSSYWWIQYKWCEYDKIYYSYPLIKYNTDSYYGTVDNKTVLDAEDDVAHVKLGDRWRIPTDAEWTQLRTKCSWTWTTVNGVNGYMVSATNGNSIFLPAAGTISDINLYYLGSEGAYWSSSLCTPPTNPLNARCVYFHSIDKSSEIERGDCVRCAGNSIRPVYE